MAVRQHEIPGHWICLLSKRKETFMGCIFLFLSRFNGGKNRQTRRVHCPRRPAGASKQLVDNKSTFQKYAQTRNPKLIKMNKIKEKKKKIKFHSKILVYVFFSSFVVINIRILFVSFCPWRYEATTTKRHATHRPAPRPYLSQRTGGGKIQKYFHVAQMKLKRGTENGPSEFNGFKRIGPIQ